MSWGLARARMAQLTGKFPTYGHCAKAAATRMYRASTWPACFSEIRSVKFLKVQVDIQIPAASLLLICRCVPVNLRRLRVGLLWTLPAGNGEGTCQWSGATGSSSGLGAQASRASDQPPLSRHCRGSCNRPGRRSRLPVHSATVPAWQRHDRDPDPRGLLTSILLRASRCHRPRRGLLGANALPGAISYEA